MSKAQRRSSAHQVFLQFHKHTAKSLKDLEDIEEEEDDEIGNQDVFKGHSPSPTQQPFEMFHHVMKTGVIYATSRASRLGFHNEDPEWANMGQGAPETGEYISRIVICGIDVSMIA